MENLNKNSIPCSIEHQLCAMLSLFKTREDIMTYSISTETWPEEAWADLCAIAENKNTGLSITCNGDIFKSENLKDLEIAVRAVMQAHGIEKCRPIRDSNGNYRAIIAPFGSVGIDFFKILENSDPATIAISIDNCAKEIMKTSHTRPMLFVRQQEDKAVFSMDGTRAHPVCQLKDDSRVMALAMMVAVKMKAGRNASIGIESGVEPAVVEELRKFGANLDADTELGIKMKTAVNRIMEKIDDEFLAAEKLANDIDVEYFYPFDAIEDVKEIGATLTFSPALGAKCGLLAKCSSDLAEYHADQESICRQYYEKESSDNFVEYRSDWFTSDICIQLNLSARIEDSRVWLTISMDCEFASGKTLVESCMTEKDLENPDEYAKRILSVISETCDDAFADWDKPKYVKTLESKPEEGTGPAV